jgi:hypothetical protein
VRLIFFLCESKGEEKSAKRLWGVVVVDRKGIYNEKKKD